MRSLFRALQRSFDSATRAIYPSRVSRQLMGTCLSIEDILGNGVADVVLVFNEAIEAYDADFADKLVILPTPDRQRGPYYLWLDKSHPLAERDKVDVSEIGGCRFLIPSSIRYQGLEHLAEMGSNLTGVEVNCTYWPGSYEECVVRIKPDETMIVSEEDRRDPAYSLVGNRTYVELVGMEDLVKPAFVFLRSNENPALAEFEDFLAGAIDRD